MAVAVAVPNSAGTEPPKLSAPAGAADCHIHIFDPRFKPVAAKPAHAAVADRILVDNPEELYGFPTSSRRLS